MTSAEIYQFPAGGRSGHGGRREEAQPVGIKSTAAFAGQASSNVASANRGSTRGANTVLGSAWYHDAAIQDAELARNS